MDDDANDQMSFCADLVTLRKTEAFPLSLLNDYQPGQWVSVKTVCQLTGTDSGILKPELASTWLLDPFGDQDYAVMIFYDDETKQSFAAHYNKRRLLNAYATASPEGEKDCHSVVGTGT